MILYITSYSQDFKGYNKKQIMSDKDLIKWNNTLLNSNDNMINYSIVLDPRNKPLYNNPIIEFFVAASTLNRLKRECKNYEYELFEYVRNLFKREYY